MAALRAPAALMTAAALRPEDVPEGFLPADDQEVFRGMRPSDPDCARLLRMVDAASGRSSSADRDVPQSHVAYYRADPAATLVEHVLRLPSGEAAKRVDAARDAVAGCPVIDFGRSGDSGWDGHGFDQTGLERRRLSHPEGQDDAVAVRYSHPDGDQRYGLDVIFAREGSDLLVLAAPGEFAGDGERRLRLMEARVLRRLANARDREKVVLTPSPGETPTPRP
ncbi:hypothetical protein EBO15_04270 [Actinomadura harenae]|uniref:Uncharacterized protein n=1 Tax=Actinomadura harenae TaxID=2483351 RepID=A0A3M2MC61_9ACTN|nr:hypothetical protein EBO15_04270 [Actinomadura harenae]